MFEYSMIEDKPTFTWGTYMDSEIDRNGITIMRGNGKREAIQRFVEDLSNLIQYKCDWCFIGGRFYIKCLSEALPAVKVALENDEWFKRYCVDYSDITWDNGTYFEPYIMADAFYGTFYPPEQEQEAIENTAHEIKEYVVSYDEAGNKIRRYIGSRYF